MPLFNYLTHHLGSFGSIYDSTLINGFAPRMRRPTYGDRIVEIPINHTKDCLLYRNNSLRAAFKYKLILGTHRWHGVDNAMRGRICTCSQLQHHVCIRTGRVKQEARSNLRQRYTICASHVLCIRKLATLYTRV